MEQLDAFITWLLEKGILDVVFIYAWYRAQKRNEELQDRFYQFFITQIDKAQLQINRRQRLPTEQNRMFEVEVPKID